MGVGEQIALHIFALGDPENSLCGNALVHVQGYRVSNAGEFLKLAGPFEPWLVIPKDFLKEFGFFLGQRAFCRGGDKFGDTVGAAGRVASKRGRKMRIVRVLDLLLSNDLPARRDPGRRDIQPGRGLVTVVNNLAFRFVSLQKRFDAASVNEDGQSEMPLEF